MLSRFQGSYRIALIMQRDQLGLVLLKMQVGDMLLIDTLHLGKTLGSLLSVRKK